MMRRLTSLLLLCSLGLALGGCQHWWKREQAPPPAEASVATQRWCYRTIGRVDCYPEPQPGMANRLVSVDPPSLIPQTPESYAKEAAGHE